MKIKTDFITNSSSTTYIIEFQKEYLSKDFEKDFTLRTGELFELFSDKIDLVKFTQDIEVDWITAVTKIPLNYWGMGRTEFREAIKILDQDKYVVYIILDRNDLDRTINAENIIIRNGGVIKHRGSD